MPKHKKKPARNNTRTNKNCRGCPALCCHDLVMRILRPRNRKEVEELKWQVQYDTVRIFITNKRWHLLIDGKCMHLTDENLCSIYDDRPDKCRRHNPPNCERYGEYWDVMINTPEELEEYLADEKKKRKRKKR
ncbi:MAG: YkgJ family cysteine cluster protein [Alphaproteobacteria bacterium]